MEDLERQLKMIAECLPPSPFRETVKKVTTAAIARIEELEMNSCSECSPDNYGWIFNRVEGKAACVCMTEAEPFQMLLKALEQIAKTAAFNRTELEMQNIAKEALRSVLPLDYAK